MALSERGVVRAAFEIGAEAIRQAKETDLGNDPEWSDEERAAVHGALDEMIGNFKALAVRAAPR